MEEPKIERPRRRLQLNLSTLVILTILLGALVGLNMMGRKVQVFHAILGSKGKTAQRSSEPEIECAYGWPFDAYRIPDEMVLVVSPRSPSGNSRIRAAPGRWHFGGLLLDAVAAISVLGFPAVAWEWMIRRRSRRATSSG